VVSIAFSIDKGLLVPQDFPERVPRDSMNRIVLSLCLTLLANEAAMAHGCAAALSTKVARYVFVVNSGGLGKVSSVDGAPGLSGPRV